MGKCRKASRRRRRPECVWCDQVIRRSMDRHLERCQVFSNAVVQAEAYTKQAWVWGQFARIPRCVMFPYDTQPCCGRADADGNLTGFCPPPR